MVQHNLFHPPPQESLIVNDDNNNNVTNYQILFQEPIIFSSFISHTNLAFDNGDDDDEEQNCPNQASSIYALSGYGSSSSSGMQHTQIKLAIIEKNE
ncbi:hypothetical protein DERP_014670 [Dermatophagoides pteronyssinus]|uniref:Uncharacterized protein n=1 Tax=Dermatophagoides pteronyssinus TaxID=6956 RepID=A0ABQ8JRK2_DERPT|nr:hypothetical protein DERP_014670 [Dermatophagoides pteronyssinus]